MKRKSTALLLSLLLLPALCVPALAAIEYGVFYDETEQLGSVELSYAAEQTLPRLTQELGVDLRVDAFTDEDVDADTSAADIAAYVYENSGYGCGEWKEGVSLTLLLRGTENGAYTLSETDWCVYAFLDEARGSAQELSDAVYNAVKPYMVERAWDGGERGELYPRKRLAGCHRRCGRAGRDGDLAARDHRAPGAGHIVHAVHIRPRRLPLIR